MVWKLLIEAGASVKSLPKERSALMLAAASGSDRCVARLINAGADVKGQSDDGMTALMIASIGGYDKCVKTILINSRWSMGNEITLVGQQEETGFTALMFAARRGHLQCVQNLLSKQASVNGQR